MAQDIRLVVFGAGKTGKSALTIQFVQENFVEKYDATVEDSYRKMAEVDGQPCQLSLLDTAGQDEYLPLKSVYYDKGDGFLIVYNVLDAASFEEAQHIYRELSKAREDYLGPESCDAGQVVPIVLVGNQIDLLDVQPRQVTTAQGKQCAQDWRCTFYETSAKTRENVEEAFHDLVRAVKKTQQRKINAEKRSRAGSQTAASVSEPQPAEHHKVKKKKKCVIL